MRERLLATLLFLMIAPGTVAAQQWGGQSRQTARKALSTVEAAQITPCSLNGFIAIRNFRGDVVSAGTGLRATGPPTVCQNGVQGCGIIKIDTIPPGSTVHSAYLYWSTLGDAVPEGADRGILNGKPVKGKLLGSDRSPCWVPASIHSFRANVTSLVQGNGTYELTGFVDSGNPDVAPSIEGASLVVIYGNESFLDDKVKTIVIYEGNCTVIEGTQASSITLLEGFEASSPVTKACLGMIVADGQTFGPLDDLLLFNGSSLGSNNFNGSAGPLWDDKTFDVTGLVPAGSASASVGLASTIDPESGLADCLTWVASPFSVSAPPPDPAYNAAQRCALDAHESCVFDLATFIPYGGDVVAASKIIVDAVCDISERELAGDRVSAIIKHALVWADLILLSIKLTAETAALAAPPSVPVTLSAAFIANLISVSINCVESQIYERVVKPCPDAQCVVKRLLQSFRAFDARLRALGIFAGSPVTIEILDQNGESLLVDTSGVVNAGIPGSWLYSLEENAKLALINNPSGEYTIVVTGNQEASLGDTFDLGVALSSDTTLLQLAYEDVPVQAGSIATLAVGPQTTDFTLQLDIDGDGQAETLVSPTFVSRNTAPVAVAGQSRRIEGTNDTGATVALDGSASFDPEGAPLTFMWTGPFPEGGGTVNGVNPTVTLPFGVSTVTMVVSDGELASAPDDVVITVTNFAVSSTPGTATVSAGQTATYTVTVAPQHGAFGNPVTL